MIAKGAESGERRDGAGVATVSDPKVLQTAGSRLLCALDSRTRLALEPLILGNEPARGERRVCRSLITVILTHGASTGAASAERRGCCALSRRRRRPRR